MSEVGDVILRGLNEALEIAKAAHRGPTEEQASYVDGVQDGLDMAIAIVKGRDN